MKRAGVYPSRPSTHVDKPQTHLQKPDVFTNTYKIPLMLLNDIKMGFKYQDQYKTEI